ncbi:hypothetical protein E1B28_001679 [Marasmius oreades]|uniref:ribonuclease H n=1 Tax=Marasmius oreades TaxID=181124 RepID=A0A9P7V490_9AGAR|nr:uncharacterized protein E1B28_001679 [Marasmius oreades]KAG7099877.1 hypothetical protein E1B28_001679 [Marasmius oreades]
MAKKKSLAFYSVRFGRIPGIYMTWDECKPQVEGFTGAKFKKFATQEEAEQFLRVGSGSVLEMVASDAANSTSATPTADSTSTITSKKRTLELDHGSGESAPKKQRVPSRNEVEDEEDSVVYSDGACKGNGKDGSVAGVGVWWGHGDPRNIAERCPGEQTNNRAELIAIARVLETTPINAKRRLVIKTDSNYSIQCFDSWLHNWRNNNWKKSGGDPVKNAPLIRYIATLLEGRISLGQKVRLVYVKGHAGIEGNEGADYLANLGTLSGPVEERSWPEEEMRYRVTLKAMSEDAKGDSARKKTTDLEVEYTEAAPDITEDGTTKPKVVGDLGDTSAPSPVDSIKNPPELDHEDLAKYAEAWVDDDDLSDDLKD